MTHALLALALAAANAPASTDDPLVTEHLGPFFLLVLLIAVVAAALKRDRPLAILKEIGKMFVVLTVGFLLFCLSLYLLGNPNAPFQ